MTDASDSQIDALRRDNDELRAQVASLKQEVSFLRTHFTLAQGMKGETLTARLTGGALAANYAESFDLRVGQDVTVEVKFSKLNTPNLGQPTRRWNWSKPLGWKDKGKDFDFLVLVGDKDPRFPDQYVDDSPYVFFLVPRGHVQEIMTKGETIGANVQLVTELARAKSPASLALKKHIVPAVIVTSLLECKVTP